MTEPADPFGDSVPDMPNAAFVYNTHVGPLVLPTDNPNPVVMAAFKTRLDETPGWVGYWFTPDDAEDFGHSLIEAARQARNL